MLNKKTIQINPELFKISGGKTRKNREKKELILNPNVTPNNLKNRLLKRIRDHKIETTNTKMKPPHLKQMSHLTNIKNANTPATVNPNTNMNTNPTTKSYTDEFYGALDYLSDLTKKQRVNEVKQRTLNTKTLKNYNRPSLISGNSDISLELPPELQETKSSFIPQTNEVFNVNYKATDDIPYGCLKNGNKKTYREWKQIMQPDRIDIPDIIRPPTPPKRNIGLSNNLQGTTLQGSTIQSSEKMQEGSLANKNSLSREERLEQIKNKLKKMQDQETSIKQQSLDDFKQLEKNLSKPLMDSRLDELELDKPYEGTNNSFDIEELIKQREDKNEKTKNKKYLKKTVKRKFTLGKSDKLRRVSVLIKDRQTRKNIINAQKALKKTTITDIKKYLRQHGMIKIGSTCPSDILRKTFESAIMTGDITNTNKETLLHNFLSSDKQD